MPAATAEIVLAATQRLENSAPSGYLRQDLGQDRILATTRRRFVFELNRIIDDDFRGRYLERELVARSPEAIPP